MMQQLKIRDIQRAVCEEFGITHTAMISHRIQRRLVIPRHVAMFLSVKLTPNSYPAIGQRFDRDHTTIMHAEKKLEKRMAAETGLAVKVARIRMKLAEIPEPDTSDEQFSAYMHKFWGNIMGETNGIR